MRSDIERILLTQEQIARRVKELAGQITADYSLPGRPGNGEITIITVLTGAMIFCADLIRHLPMRMRIGMLAVSSYPGTSTAAKACEVHSRQLGDVRGRQVLLVDDILDSGGTVRVVREMLQSHGPASLRACVLLRKPTEGAKQTPVDYVGFEIPDEFVVGYGLDWGDYYRNLPEIVTLKRGVIERALGGG
jgi:hypoxanthine phosphoribosyltransferase